MEFPDLSDLNLAEKEQKILESAIKIFSEKGFSAATTSEIAKDAGVAEGTIFRYFKTKKDILRGILIQTINLISGKVVVESIENLFLESKNKYIREILKELLYNRMNLINQIFPMVRIIITEALYHEDVREALYQNIITRAVDIFKRFHTQMVERGMMRNDAEPEVLFRSILGNLGLLILQNKFFSDKFNFQDMDTEIDKMLDILLFGIAQPSK